MSRFTRDIRRAVKDGRLSQRFREIGREAEVSGGGRSALAGCS